ncbi:MAG TPA: hypothetical protein VJ301_13520, partial [Propionibacteriaceae bacterium]|nr:hypothetical protein [Propionibacteriaceae bacterium]
KAVQHLVGLVADPDTGYLFREQLRDAKRHWDQMRGTRQAAEARAVPLPWAAPGVLREHAGLVATLVKGSDLRTDPVRCGKILQALLARVVVQFEPQGLKLFGPLFSQASPPSLAQVCVPSLFPQQCLGQMEHIGDSHQGLQYAIPLAPGRRERL